VRHKLLALIVVAAFFNAQPLVAQAPPAAKQETAKPEIAKPSSARPDTTAARLVVTLSRYQGDKKISSLPYSLAISIPGARVDFNMGAQVPYAVSPPGDTGKTPAYSYRNVGIQIRVTGQTVVEPGQYKMEINVDDNNLSSSNQIQGAPTISGVPIFRTFSTGGTLVLRDGQASQLTTAADPITGETMRVDVTLHVQK
jgi:Flp pilus assembly secretin CpaC